MTTILKIFYTLGTPSESTWPVYSCLQRRLGDEPSFDGSQSHHLRTKVEALFGDCGWPFVLACWTYDPLRRLRAHEGLAHGMLTPWGVSITHLPFSQYSFSQTAATSACAAIIADTANEFVRGSCLFFEHPEDSLRCIFKGAVSKWKDGDGSLIEHLLPGDTLEMRSLGVHNAHMLSGLIADVRLGGGVVSCTATPWHATRTGNTFGIFADAQHGPVRVVEPHKHGHTGAQLVEARGHGASAEIAAYIFSDCGLLFTMACHINSLEVTVIQPKQTLASLPRDDATFDGCPPQTATAPASIRAEEAGLASPANVEAVGGRPSAPAAALVDNDAAAEDVDTLLRPG